MSYEVWGSDDDFYGPDWRDDAVDAGWIDPDDLSPGVIAIWQERQRQQDVEGWTAEHDDRHGPGALAGSASAYAMSAAAMAVVGSDEPVLKEPPPFLGFSADWWKPKSRRQDLVRAGALIAAEIDRLDRQERGAQDD